MRMFHAVSLALLVGLPAVARADAAADAKTKRLWAAKCGACHGAAANGDTVQGKKMGISDFTSKEWQGRMTDAMIVQTISNGLQREKDGKQQKMDPFKEKLKPEEIQSLVGYLRSVAR